MTSPYAAEIPVASDAEAIENAIRGHLTQVWFAMPAIAAEDTKDGHIGKLQIAVNGTVIDGNGKKTHPPYPLLDDVPIHHHGGGKNVHTMPLVKGDEVLPIFTSRPHDTWHQSGGTDNNPIDARVHHMSDAFMVRGFRSNPRKIKNVSNESSQNRSEDGKHTHDIHPDHGLTSKSVDKDDKADNPWKDAKKYFQSFVKHATGVYHQAVDDLITHQSLVDHKQIVHSLNNGKHTITMDHVAETIVNSLFDGKHKIDMSLGGIVKSINDGVHKITMDSVANTIVHSLFEGKHKIDMSPTGIINSINGGQHSITMDGVANTIVHSMFGGASKINMSVGGVNLDAITDVSKLLKTASIAQLTNYIKF